ncbi:MAG: hypothetical protein LBL45_05330 [Treponema sp.]|jgi:NAD/NADP transhydrogenase alpha subunit|nr:hypothetical protein [Treponema sp.]
MARIDGKSELWNRAVEQAKKEMITSDYPVFGLKTDSQEFEGYVEQLYKEIQEKEDAVVREPVKKQRLIISTKKLEK